MAEDAEIEGAFREAERFAKLLGAFVAVRGVAQRHVAMKQEIIAMEKEQAKIKESIAKLKQDAVDAERDNAAKVGSLNADFHSKESVLQKHFDEKSQHFQNAINDLVNKHQSAADKADTAQVEALRKITDFDKSVAAAQAKADDEIAKINKSIADKQKQLDAANNALMDFKRVHAL
jgi:hypothetical protein